MSSVLVVPAGPTGTIAETEELPFRTRRADERVLRHPVHDLPNDERPRIEFGRNPVVLADEEQLALTRGQSQRLLDETQ
jgi:hypothetical protein